MTNNELHNAALISFGSGVVGVLRTLGHEPDRQQIEILGKAAIQAASSLAAAHFKFDPVNDRDLVKAIGDKLTSDLFAAFDLEAAARS